MNIKSAAVSFFSSILEQLKVYDTNKTILVDGFDPQDEYCLKVDSFFKDLYCVELAKSGNIPIHLPEEEIINIFNDHKNDPKGYLISALVKKDEYQKNYIFTFSKPIAQKFETGMGGRLLHAFEIINAIYDLFLDNEYSVQSKQMKRMLDMSEKVNYENPFSTFNGVIKEAVYGNLSSVDLFQAYQFSASNKSVDMYELFKMNFTGVLYTYINFSKNAVMPAITRRIWQSTFIGTQKQFKELRKTYEDGEVRLALINSVLVLRKGYRHEIPGNIGNKVKASFVHKNLFGKDILRYTPIIKRDTKYDRIVDWNFFINYFTMVHKASTDVPDFYGRDLMGGFVNYGLRYPVKGITNTRPHTLLFGPTGSGKTTAVGKIMALMLGVDYKTWEAKNMHAKYFRLYDIKRSMRPLTDRLETNKKNDVKFLSADLNYFQYNLINISEFQGNSIDKVELAFAANLFSVIIDTLNKGKGVGVTADEIGLFTKSVRQLYEEKNYKGAMISDLQEIDPKAFHAIISLGYQDFQMTTETTEPEFEYLRKPTLKDLINLVKQNKTDRTLSAVQKKIMEEFELKLMTVDHLGYFSGYDRIDLKTGKYIYADMDAIKDIPEYVPIFLAIFNRSYTADKKRQSALKEAGKPRPEINYIFEEAKNLFIVPSFQPILAKLVNEARSYDIVIIFLIQRIEDVPSYIFSQIENKLILFPADEEKNDIINEIVKIAKPNQEIVELFRKTPQYGMTIWYEHGGFVMKFDLDETEIKIFESEGEKISAVEARALQ